MESDLDQLAASFVTQYYEGLLLQPGSLAACYGPDSTMCIFYSSGDSVEAKGADQVRSQMEALSNELPEATKKLQVVHAEIFPSFDASSLIIVDGIVMSPDSTQEFSHTVILRNNGVEGEYYIRNDVWRFSAPVSTIEEAPPAAAATVAAEVPAEVEEEEEAVEVAEEDHTAENGVVDQQQSDAASAAAESETTQSAVDSAVPAESPSKQSASPSETEEVTPPAATPPKAAEKPKGPTSWASKARSGPAPGAPVPPPQRVSPKPAHHTKEVPKEAQKKEAHKKEAEPAPHHDERSKRQAARSFLAIKVRDVTDAEINAAIPDSLKGGMVSLRNLSSEKSRVFIDFVDPNAMDILTAANIRIAGKPVSIEPQNIKSKR